MDKFSHLEIEDITTVSFYKWIRNDSGHVERVKVTKSVTDGMEYIKQILPNFLIHHLQKRHQSEAFKQHKSNLGETDLILHFDFSENYTCTYQDASQSAYWCQKQVTIFTVGSYLKDQSTMFAYVTDCTDHSKSTVSVLLDMMLKRFGRPEFNVRFWSDGPSSQFKNKYMAHYIKLLREKHNLKSLEWNFSVTSHGKGAIDGVGGSLKRSVWRQVKARKSDVRNAEEFVKVIKDINSGVNVILVPESVISFAYNTINSKLDNAPKVITVTYFQ